MRIKKVVFIWSVIFGVCLSLKGTVLINASEVPEIGANSKIEIKETLEVIQEETSEYVIEEGVLIKYNGSGSDIVIPEGVTKIGDNSFENCVSLKSVILPEGVQSLGISSFMGCVNLERVQLPNTLQEIGNRCFELCGNLSSIHLPEGLIRIGGSSFWNCNKLTDIKLPESLEHIGEWCFEGCSSLTNIEIPSKISTLERNTFAECTSLASVSFPEGLLRIGIECFDKCDKLTNIKLPESVITLGDQCFGCKNLETIYIPRETVYFGDSCFALGSGLIVYGVSGSMTEIYAKRHGFLFKDINATEAISTPEPVKTPEVTITPQPTPTEVPNYVEPAENLKTVVSSMIVKAINGKNSSFNKNKQNYKRNWSEVVTSYLYENSKGNLVRVEADEGVLVEEYNEEFKLMNQKKIPMELPIFGGFYAGIDYNFLIFGQSNLGENDAEEVVRIVKYDKEWNRLGSVGLEKCNTTIPFSSGSLRCVQAGDILYILTSHQMYGWGGQNHQANMRILVDINNMSIIRHNSSVSNYATGYVSHSFNQFIQATDKNIISVDHGDAHPRGILLYQEKREDFIDSSEGGNRSYAKKIYSFPGETGDNRTGATLGGMELSSTSCLIAGSSIIQDSNYKNNKVDNIFLITTDINGADNSPIKRKWITNYKEGGPYSAGNPQLVKISSDLFLLLWQRMEGSGTTDIYYDTKTEKINYVYLDGQGNIKGDIYSANGSLSDCQPINYKDSIVWYTTENIELIFWKLGKEPILGLPEETSDTNKKDESDKETITEITLNRTEIILNKKDSVSLFRKVTPSNLLNPDLLWSSSNKKVATVDQSGKVKAINSGKAIITLKARNNEKVKDTCEVIVPYTIQYQLNGGNNNKSNPLNYYDVEIKLKSPKKNGYVFQGWYIDKNYKNKITTIKKGTKKNYILYAKWEKVNKPKQVILDKVVSVSKNKMKVSLKSKIKKADGYQIVYAEDKGFKKNKKTKNTKSIE